MAAMSESQGWKGHCHARHLSSCCKLETQPIQLVHNSKYKKQMKSAEMQILKKARVMQIICQRMEKPRYFNGRKMIQHVLKSMNILHFYESV